MCKNLAPSITKDRRAHYSENSGSLIVHDNRFKMPFSTCSDFYRNISYFWSVFMVWYDRAAFFEHPCANRKAGKILVEFWQNFPCNGYGWLRYSVPHIKYLDTFHLFGCVIYACSNDVQELLLSCFMLGKKFFMVLVLKFFKTHAPVRILFYLIKFFYQYRKHRFCTEHQGYQKIRSKAPI